MKIQHIIIMCLIIVLCLVFIASQKNNVSPDDSLKNTNAHKAQEITPTELKKEMDHNTITLIDVREQYEYDEGHLQNSILIPLSEFSPEKVIETEKPLVFYCRSGARSMSAAKKMLTHLPTHKIYSLRGGIIAWKSAGFPLIDS